MRTARPLFLAALLTAGLSTAASAVTAAPSARRVADREISAWTHVTFARVDTGGDVYLCERGSSFAVVTGSRQAIPAAQRACFHRATQSVFVVLVGGRVTRRLEVDHAPGLPQQAIYEDSSGQYFGRFGAACWTKATATATSGSGLGQFIAFPRAERLSLAPSRGGLRALRGVLRHGRVSITELDLLNPSSDRTRYEIDSIAGPGRLHARITHKFTKSTTFPVTSPAPLCAAGA